MSTKQRGTVKFYTPQKEYGFVTGDDGTDYMVHISALKASQIIPNDFARGLPVEFVPVPGRDGKRMRAAEIRMLG